MSSVSVDVAIHIGPDCSAKSTTIHRLAEGSRTALVAELRGKSGGRLRKPWNSKTRKPKRASPSQEPARRVSRSFDGTVRAIWKRVCPRRSNRLPALDANPNRRRDPSRRSDPVSAGGLAQATLATAGTPSARSRSHPTSEPTAAARSAARRIQVRVEAVLGMS